MAVQKQLEFMLVRYVPDVVKGEFVNIGIVLLDGSRTHVHFTDDWRAVRALDPAAEFDVLGAMETDLNTQLTSGVLDRTTFLAKLQDYLSSGVAVTKLQGIEASDTATALESLEKMYLKGRRKATREARGRDAIYGYMREAFKESEVWEHPLMQKRIAASKYTRIGDPLKIDCGYRSEKSEMLKLFQAVSVATDANTAKILAFSYPKLREGIARVEKVDALLTAIIEPRLNEQEAQIAFAIEALKGQGIAVATTLDLPTIAENARDELHI